MLDNPVVIDSSTGSFFVLDQPVVDTQTGKVVEFDPTPPLVLSCGDFVRHQHPHFPPIFEVRDSVGATWFLTWDEASLPHLACRTLDQAKLELSKYAATL